MVIGSDPQRIEAVAADWLAQRDAGRWGPDDQQALELWIARATLHRVTFLRLEAAWNRAEQPRTTSSPATDQLGVVQSVPPRVNLQLAPVALTSPYAVKKAARFPWRLVAAIVVAVSIGSLAYHLLEDGPSAQQLTQVESTAVGEQRKLQLADGSIVELNTDTRLRYAVDAGMRTVAIELGEAFFDVVHDAKRPFTVLAGPYQIKVLGTRFGLRFDGQVLRAVVLDGRVQVAQVDVSTMSNRDLAPLAVLQQGDVLAASVRRAPVVSRVPLERLEDTLGWRRGELVLNDFTLAEAAAEFNRYNLRQLVLTDAAVARLRVGGRFDPRNVGQFARLLASGFGLTVLEDANRIVVSSTRTGS